MSVALLPTSNGYVDDGFVYAFVVYDEFAGTVTRFLRHDRKIFDWIFEPVPDEDFHSGTAYVHLPKGYYLHLGRIYHVLDEPPKTDNKLMMSRETRIAIDLEEDPIEIKAFISLRGAEDAFLEEFENAEVPDYRVFHLTR